MTLLDLMVRWLRYRGASLAAAGGGVQVQLAPDDPLRGQLGEDFTLAEVSPDSMAPPGVEPVYPGSRIADLCAREMEGVRGIAVALGQAGPDRRGPLFVFSFRAVYQSVERAERLIRFALTTEGLETAIPEEPACRFVDVAIRGPADPAAPLEPAVDGGNDWRHCVQRLYPAACAVARKRALQEGRSMEQRAQRHLYLTARRLAHSYSQHGERAEEEAGIHAQHRQRLADEIDRHRLQIRVGLLGVTVVL